MPEPRDHPLAAADAPAALWATPPHAASVRVISERVVHKSAGGAVAQFGIIGRLRERCQHGAAPRGAAPVKNSRQPLLGALAAGQAEAGKAGAEQSERGGLGHRIISDEHLAAKGKTRTETAEDFKAHFA